MTDQGCDCLPSPPTHRRHIRQQWHIHLEPSPNSKLEWYGAPVNVAIRERIGPIPHNLVCTWHLALNHKNAGAVASIQSVSKAAILPQYS